MEKIEVREKICKVMPYHYEMRIGIMQVSRSVSVNMYVLKVVESKWQEASV